MRGAGLAIFIGRHTCIVALESSLRPRKSPLGLTPEPKQDSDGEEALCRGFWARESHRYPGSFF